MIGSANNVVLRSGPGHPGARHSLSSWRLSSLALVKKDEQYGLDLIMGSKSLWKKNISRIGNAVTQSESYHPSEFQMRTDIRRRRALRGPCGLPEHTAPPFPWHSL